MGSRRWKQRRNVQNIKLFILDEAHLIGGTNGPIMEVITSRMRYIASQTENKIRIVALAASIANARDVGEWIGCTSKTLFNFHPNVRPIPLEIHMQGFDNTHLEARILSMHRPLVSALRKYGTRPSIVFVPSRKHCLRVGFDIRTYCDSQESPKDIFLRCSEEDLKPHLERVQNDFLREKLLPFGIAFIHENLSEQDKRVVQVLFTAGAISVLIATYSFCWALTVSSYMVVIMDTQYYDGKEHRFIDYPVSDLLHMMGRAGRPEDKSGVCVLFCH